MSDGVRQPVPLADRGFTAAWLAYPLALFTLPNAWKIGPVSPETLMSAAYSIIFFLSVLVYRRPSTAGELTVAIPRAWIAFALVSVVAIGIRSGPVGLFRSLTWVAVPNLTVSLFRSAALRRKLWWVMALAGCTSAIWALISLPLPMPEKTELFAWTHRTVFGYFLAITLLVMVHLALTVEAKLKPLLILGVAAVAATLAFSLARGAWVGAFAGFVILFARRPKQLGLALLAAAAVGTAIVATSGDGAVIGARLRSLVDSDVASSSLYRANLYLAAIRSIPDSWLLGADMHGFGPYLARFSLLRYPHFYSPEFEPDSDVIRLLLLGGLPLLCLFVWLGLTIARSALQVAFQGDADERVRAGIACVVGCQMLFDNILSNSLGWFYLGLIFTLPRRPSNARGKNAIA